MMGATKRAGVGNRRVVLAGALMMTTALATNLAVSPAWAQQATVAPPTIAQLQSEQAFDIPAQPLTDALVAFGQQSGVQVTVNGTVARNVSAPTVQGTMTSEQALRQLLAGSGLIYTMSGSTVAIERPGQSSDGAIVLDPVTVEGRTGPPRQAEIGNLPPEYPGGQVARGGKLGMLGNKDIMDTPFNQTNYTSKLIEDRQAKTINDVLESDPSVSGLYPASSGNVLGSIRGFGISLDREVAVDGLYGMFPGSTVLPSESYERIEILKGPSALINGISPNGAIGGTVNLVPKRAEDQPVTRFTPDYTSNTQFGGHIDVGRRFGKDAQFGVRFNGVFRDGETPIDNQSQERQLATLGADYSGERVRLSMDLGYHLFNVDAPRRLLQLAAGAGVPEAPESSSNFAQPWTYIDSKVWNGALRGEVDIFDNLTAYAAGGIGHFERDFLAPNTLTLQDAAGTLTSSVLTIQRERTSATLEAGVRGEFESGPLHHTVSVAGSKFKDDDSFFFASANLPTSNLYNPVFTTPINFANVPDPGDTPKASENENTGLALADTLSVLDERIQLTLGARWQRVESTSFNTTTGAVTSKYDEDAITPAVGLVVKPSQNVSIYANYIEGLSKGSTAPVTAANAGEVFPPTATEQYEAGVKIDTGDFGMTFSAFQISQPNSFTNPTTNIFAVDGEQRNRGLERFASNLNR